MRHRVISNRVTAGMLTWMFSCNCVQRTAFLLLLALAIGIGPVTKLQAQSRSRGITTGPDVPAVKIEYSALLDDSCSQSTNRPLDADLVAHVAAMLQVYRAQWAARGPELLRTESEVAGQPFAYHEAFPAIITCDLPSISFPLILNARLFRAGRAAGSEPGEMAVFVNVLWHEMSHRFVHDIRDRFPGRMTPLLSKYSTEPPVVINHLHLYAIEQLVYRRLGMQQDLEFMRTIQRQPRHAAVFERAQEIVAKEGAEAFVQELRTAPPSRDSSNK